MSKLRRVLRANATLRAGATAAALSFGAAALPAHALAQPNGRGLETGAAFAPDEPPAAFIAQRGSLSLSQATAIAQSRFQGRVVRAETVQQGNRIVYEIRILGNDGRVRTVRIDAETGAVM